MITVAYVNIWNKRVGTVMWNLNSETALFEYDPIFLMTGLNLSPIKMNIYDDRKSFSFPELRKISTFKGLPGLLSDSLPDTYGTEIMNAWLLNQGRLEYSLNPIEMLCFIGNRGMGALEFLPSNAKVNNRSSELEIDNLIKVASDILSDKINFRSKLSENKQEAIMDIIRIGTSAGGARAKAIIAYNPKTKEVRSGQTDAPNGFSHWIIKFDGIQLYNKKPDIGHGKLEFAYYRMAKDCGIEMSECHLLEENGRSHFMTKRFDREGNKKVHMQSFCAMEHLDFNGTSSYERVFQTMRVLNLPYPQFEQLYRQMVFNVMAMNYDDHAKNFAFLMGEDGIWKLAPAYDVVYSYRDNFQGRNRASTINGKKNGINKEDLLQIAKSLDIKKPNRIIDQISEVVSRWVVYANMLDIDTKVIQMIDRTLIKM